MADVEVNHSVGFGSIFSTVRTYPVTIPDGLDDPYIAVGCQVHGDRWVNSVTYNGTSCPLIDYGSYGGKTRGFLHGLVNPTADGNPHNVVITVNGNTTILGGCVVFKQVHQDNPLGTSNSAAGYSATASVSVASYDGGIVVDALGCLGGSWGLYPGAGQTLRWKYGTDPGGGQSTEPGTGSNVTMSWGLTDKWWAIAGVCVRPQAADAGPTAIAMFYERYNGFMKRLKGGLIPPSHLEEEYGLVMSAMPQGVCLP